jgi:hypothetical protein
MADLTVWWIKLFPFYQQVPLAAAIPIGYLSKAALTRQGSFCAADELALGQQFLDAGQFDQL